MNSYNDEVLFNECLEAIKAGHTNAESVKKYILDKYPGLRIKDEWFNAIYARVSNQ